MFNSLVLPISFYGCEIWGYTDVTVIERLQLRFCNLFLNLKQSTPNVMVYGELDLYPFLVQIKCRMISFCHRLVHGNENKYYFLLYKLAMKGNPEWLLLLNDVYAMGEKHK